MQKIYLLDTSVLIDDPEAPKYYHKVYLPIEVIEELDSLKTIPGKVGQQARRAIKYLENFKNSKKHQIQFDINNYKHSWQNIADNRILAAALAWQKKHNRNDLILVSQDFNLRLKAKIAGLGFTEHKHISSYSDLFSGIEEIIDDALFEKLLQQEYVACPDYLQDLYPNQCLIVQGNNNSICARKYGQQIKGLIKNQRVRNFEAKNKEQALAVELLTDYKIPLVSLAGTSGVGKTLLTLAVGLQLVEDGKYQKVIIYKPIESVGKDIGLLPGSSTEKLIPWMGSIFDNLEVLIGGNHKKSRRQNFWNLLQDYQDHGLIEFNAISHIRGRSINNSFILFDEFQNTTQEEAKTILTRVGHNSKIVLTGDIEQIDKNCLDIENNGLTYVIEKFRKSEQAAHLTLVKGERSALATEASKIL